MKKEVRLPYFVITLEKGERLNRPVTAMSMMWDGVRLEDLPAEGEIGCIIKDQKLSPGEYCVIAGVMSKPSAELGEKWYLPLAELGSVVVTPGTLVNSLIGLPALHLVSQLPPVIVDHVWCLNGHELTSADVFEYDVTPVR